MPTFQRSGTIDHDRRYVLPSGNESGPVIPEQLAGLRADDLEKISMSGIQFGGAMAQQQPKASSELSDALGRLNDAWQTLRKENARLRDRLESVTRPAVPVGNASSAVNPVAPVRSSIGHSINETADQLYAEASNICDLIERLAV